MDGVTHKPLSSPKRSVLPNPSLPGSRETNENEQPLEQKPTKHFMSPTISTASKASFPRKKVLSEKNEISSSIESHPHKASNLCSKTSSLNSISHRSGKLPVSSSDYASESDDEQQNNFTVESSDKPYDPITNNLAPRPKFLRYKPNRRHGIIQKKGSPDTKKSNDDEESLRHAQEGHDLKPENESCRESVVEDDEEMEEVVDQEWSLKGLFKILLLVIVFFLSGSSLSSGSSMLTSDTCNMIQKNIFEAVFHEIYGNGDGYVDLPEHSRSGFLELSQRNTDYELEAAKSVEDIVGILKVETAEMERTSEPQEELPSANIDIDIEKERTEESMSLAEGEVTSSNEVEEEKPDEQLMKDQTLEKKDPDLEDISSTFGNVQCSHSSYKFEQAEAERVERISQENAREEEILETELEGAEDHDTVLETSNLDIEVESEIVEVQESGPNNTAIVVGISAGSVLLASLGTIIYVLRKTRASIESPRAEILNQVIASAEGELLKGKTETSAKFSSLHESLYGPSEKLSNSLEYAQLQPKESSFLFDPKKEASKEINQISSPNVELLGEMAIREVSSSSLRSCVRKNSIIEAEASLAHSTALPPDDSETDSPSYGSFTAEKKIIKKKVKKGGEEVEEVLLITPVRRSGRIRDRGDRGVMSP